MTPFSLPLPVPGRPVKRETRSVWRAAVDLRHAGHTVARLGRRSHVIDGRQRTTRDLLSLARELAADPLYIPHFLRRRG